jgi:tetratricopeptide (TPR) repeat protein
MASRKTGEVSLQALDREYAYREIADGPPEEFGRTALELRAAEFYAGIRTPQEQWRSLEDLEPQLAEVEHCSRAGAYDRALEVLGTVDERLTLWGHYLRLIELRTGLLDKPVRPELRAANLAGLGGCLQALGEYDAAVPHVEEAIRISREQGDSESEIRHTGNLGRLYRNIGDMDQAVTCLERALAFYDARRDRPWIAVWSDRVGLAYWHRGQLREAVTLATRGLELAREVGDGRTEAAALSNIALIQKTEGEIEAAKSVLTDSVEIARRVGDRRGEVIAVGRLGDVALVAGDVATAIDRHTEALELARVLGERREQSYQLMGLGRARSVQGDFAAGAELLLAARDLDVPETSYLAGVGLGIVHWRAGDVARASAAFVDGARRCRERLGRCDRLFAARYALATALAGSAACCANEPASNDLLTAAGDELARALANCPGHGVVAATSNDLGYLREGAATGIDALVGQLDIALGDGRPG